MPSQWSSQLQLSTAHLRKHRYTNQKLPNVHVEGLASLERHALLAGAHVQGLNSNVLTFAVVKIVQTNMVLAHYPHPPEEHHMTLKGGHSGVPADVFMP